MPPNKPANQPDRKRQIWRHHFDKAFKRSAKLPRNSANATAILADSRRAALEHADAMMKEEATRFEEKDDAEV